MTKKQLVGKFFMIKFHTDQEITSFLQENANAGLALVKVVGNRFYFEKRPYDGMRVCALSLYRFGDEFSTEIQVREKLATIRKTGWDCVEIGKQETLKDVRRHVYLKEEVNGSEIPVADQRSEARARLRGKFKSLSNLLLCAVLVTFLAFVFGNSLVKVLSNNLYIAFTALASLLIATCCVLSAISFADRFFIRKKAFCLDVATRFISWSLVFAALFLAFDTLTQDKSSSERVKIGSSVYNLYSDSIPLKLEDMGADTTLPYRTTRHSESESFLASYSYNFDECFGVKEGETVYDLASVSDVKVVSYTIFESRYSSIRSVAGAQLVPDICIRQPELEKVLQVDEVYMSKENDYVICNKDRILTVKSGFVLDNPALVKLAALIK